jgi:hypothetical protein
LNEDVGVGVVAVTDAGRVVGIADEGMLNGMNCGDRPWR